MLFLYCFIYSIPYSFRLSVLIFLSCSGLIIIVYFFIVPDFLSFYYPLQLIGFCCKQPQMVWGMKWVNKCLTADEVFITKSNMRKKRVFFVLYYLEETCWGENQFERGTKRKGGGTNQRPLRGPTESLRVRPHWDQPSLSVPWDCVWLSSLYPPHCICFKIEIWDILLCLKLCKGCQSQTRGNSYSSVWPKGSFPVWPLQTSPILIMRALGMSPHGPWCLRPLAILLHVYETSPYYMSPYRLTDISPSIRTDFSDISKYRYDYFFLSVPPYL